MLSVEQANVFSASVGGFVLKAESSKPQSRLWPTKAKSKKEEEEESEEEAPREGTEVDDQYDIVEKGAHADKDTEGTKPKPKPSIASAKKGKESTTVSGADVDTSMMKLNVRKEALHQKQKEFEQIKANVQQAQQALEVQRVQTEHIMNVNQDRSSKILLNAKIDVDKQKV